MSVHQSEERHSIEQNFKQCCAFNFTFDPLHVWTQKCIETACIEQTSTDHTPTKHEMHEIARQQRNGLLTLPNFSPVEANRRERPQADTCKQGITTMSSEIP